MTETVSPKLGCDWFDADGGGDRCDGDEVVAAAMIDPFIMCVALRAEADMQLPIACGGGDGGRQITDSSADGESFLLQDLGNPFRAYAPAKATSGCS